MKSKELRFADREASTDVERSWLFGLLTYRVIRDLDVAEDYLRRWDLRLPFGFSLKLHHILRPDGDRCEHDHPWNWVRIILWGGYEEERNGEFHALHPGSISFFPVAFRHRILHLPKRHSWSLVITGPRRKEWGFWTTSGWIHWKRFIKEPRGIRVAWCDEGKNLGD